jgi:hypothetical protein
MLDLNKLRIEFLKPSNGTLDESLRRVCTLAYYSGVEDSREIIAEMVEQRIAELTKGEKDG